MVEKEYLLIEKEDSGRQVQKGENNYPFLVKER